MPSGPVRVTEREPCSHDTRLPSASKRLPLALLLGVRRVASPPPPVHFFSSLAGMSLKASQPPCAGVQAGPSVNFIPLATLRTVASWAAPLLNAAASRGWTSGA